MSALNPREERRLNWSRGPRIEWIETPDGCWIWDGYFGGGGYGDVQVSGMRFKAHRLIFQWERGPIPNGLELDHLCRNRRCVNPDHLEPVTHWENQRRGNTFTARNIIKTHCIHGHEFTPENTYTGPNRTKRECRECDRIKKRVK